MQYEWPCFVMACPSKCILLIEEAVFFDVLINVDMKHL